MAGVKDFESRDDGMWVRWGLNNTSAAKDARELFRTGDATGLSVGFYPVPNRTYDTEDSDGNVTLHRQEIRLDHVAMTARPAYPDAQIASVRGEPAPGVETREDPAPPPEGTPRLDHYRGEVRHRVMHVL